MLLLFFWTIDKHTGEMIGFSNLGEYLVDFEKSVSDDNPPSLENAPKLAKTMMVFMVGGLFSRLEFPYAQFPCADLSMCGETMCGSLGRIVVRT